MLQGEPRLAIAADDGTFRAVAASAIPTLFGRAECVCDTSDVNLELALTQPLPAGTAGVAELWVGDDSCLSFAERTSTSSQRCQKIVSLSIQDLTIAGSGLIHLPIPARSLFAPFTHDCSSAPSAHNGVYLFAYADPANPLATCTLPLTETMDSPPPPIGVNAERQADGSVLVRWAAADDPSARIVAYDVLCMTDDGAAIGGSASNADFSQCTTGPTGITRRALPARDGGVIVGAANPRPDLGLTSPQPEAVCAHVVASATSVAIKGLDATRRVHIAVLGADAYGNGFESPVVTVEPAPAPAPHGGCSVGGRASVTPWALILAVAALSLLVARRRAR